MGALRIASPGISTAEEFSCLGEQLLAILDAPEKRQRREPIDPRLEIVHKRAAAAGASEQVPADGGFLLAPQFSNALVKRMYRVGEILNRCTEMPITVPNANGIKFPQFSEDSRANGSRLGGVSVYWENEADTLIASKPKFQITEMTAQKVIGLLYLTDELAADSNALDSWASWAFAHELTFSLENKIVNGTGSGQPQGILNAGCLVSIAKETGQAAATVLSQNVIKMVARLWPPSRKNTAWLYNPQLLPQLSVLNIPVGSGGSIANLWQFASGDGEWDSLCGLPAIPSEYCQVPGTPGDLILGDFSRYVVAMRGGIQADVSIHVNFLTDELAFRFMMRVNGQPADRSPVTPLYGTDTISPFVALAAR